MAARHTVKSYDADLGLLKSQISEMGREVEDQIDGIYADLLSELRADMSEDPDSIKTFTGLIFVAKCWYSATQPHPIFDVYRCNPQAFQPIGISEACKRKPPPSTDR
jgi:phosphate uptake regulator